MTATKALSAKDMNSQKIVNLGDGTAAADAVNKGQLDANAAADRSRANHTGSQLYSTISDADAGVRANRLDQMAAPTAPVGMNSQKITSLADPTVAQDAATKAYVDAQISGLSTGLVLKGSVRAATDVNVNIASPGGTIDGVTAASGDIYWLRNQTTGSQNGPWVWNGAATAMTRPANFDSSAEAVLGSFWDVREGTHADTFLLMTNDTAITLGTTTLNSVIRGTAAGWTGYTVACPAVAAGANWVVTHNKGSKLYTWQVYRTASPFDDVDVYGVRTDVNTLTITPDVAMASGEYTVAVM